MIVPKILTFFVTNRCNAKCNHCFNWKNIRVNELTLEEIQKIDFSIFNSVSITGGEPTMREDLAEICRHVAKTKIYLNTNGLNPQYLKEVIDKNNANRINVTVSLDGTKDIHNQIRGINCFDQAIETIKQCKKTSTNTTILTTISRTNMADIHAFINYLKTENLYTKKGDVIFNIARGLQHVFNLNPTISFYHNPKDNNAILTPTEFKTIFNQIKQYMTNQNRIVWEYSLKILNQQKKAVTCYAGNIDMVLHANGDIAACEYTKPFTNIKNHNFDPTVAWNSKNAQITRKELTNCYCIHPCNLNTSIPRTLTGIIKLAPDIAKNKTNKFKNKI
ncbi:MAG: radical SAM protein [Candidatus Bathyarchaeota archaeon]|nr:radical SAM protein [Candidatus Termiticorpusculum sp.]